jgi:2-keto-3-deoxy-L-rhamnonate aldolase RhmA
MIEACWKHGKHPGMGGVYDPAVMQRYVSMGARLILSGSDLAFLMAGARAQASAVRAMGDPKGT